MTDGLYYYESDLKDILAEAFPHMKENLDRKKRISLLTGCCLTDKELINQVAGDYVKLINGA